MLTSHFRPHSTLAQPHANARHVLHSLSRSQTIFRHTMVWERDYFIVASFPGVLFFWRLGLRLFQSSKSLSLFRMVRGVAGVWLTHLTWWSLKLSAKSWSLWSWDLRS